MSPAATEKLLPIARRRIVPWLVGLIGCALSALVAGLLYQHEERSLVREIERRADLRHALLSAKFRQFEEALYSLKVLFQGSENVTLDEFRLAATQIRERIPGIQALQWCPIVTDSELEGFLARCREKISPSFAISERNADGLVSPATTPRGERALITYTVPLEGNQAALGFDTFTSANAPTLARARARPGEATLGESFKLVQGDYGMIYCAYVTYPGPPLPPEAGKGFVQVVLRLDQALASFFAFSATAVHDTLIVDVTGPARPLLLHSPGEIKPRVTPIIRDDEFDTPYAVSRDLSMGGRSLRVHFRPTEAWLSSRRSLAPLISLLNGLLFTGVCVAYLRNLRNRAELVQRQVAERTAELAESRALLDEITDHNPSCIWVKDTSLRYQFVNLAFAVACGRQRADILARSDDEVHPPELAARMRELDQRILANGETVSLEETHTRGDSVRIYLVTRFPLKRSDGTLYAVAGVATEITALREAEARHLGFERKLLEARKLESLGVLAGGVAHDFNNLLTGILGHANLLRAQLDAASPLQPSLEQIEISAHRAADLCRQMLAYSGRGRFSTAPVDVGGVVRDTSTLLHLSLSRRARLHLDLAPGLPSVIADVSQMRQIVMNLLLNASEALVDGKGDITVRTRVARADAALFASCVLAPRLPAGDYAVLEVEDNGCGMSESVIARIFDPFFSTKFTGRGLGLAAVLGIVRGHNGALKVDSQTGRGTTFQIFLPVSSLPAADAAAAPQPATPAPARRLAKLNLLLVDDDQAVRETTAALLKAAGHRCESFEDGEKALRLFEQSPDAFHAALLDLTMPGLGGMDLLGRLRMLRPALPVVIISGHGDYETIGVELRELSGVRFLAKPFTLAALENSLAEVVRAQPVA